MKTISASVIGFTVNFTPARRGALGMIPVSYHIVTPTNVVFSGVYTPEFNASRGIFSIHVAEQILRLLRSVCAQSASQTPEQKVWARSPQCADFSAIYDWFVGKYEIAPLRFVKDSTIMYLLTQREEDSGAERSITMIIDFNYTPEEIAAL